MPNLLNNEFSELCIINLPHSSRVIPDYSSFFTSKDILDKEMDLVTDTYSDTIFPIESITCIKAEFSRVFCDVERFPDYREYRLESLGRGWYPTHTDSGLKIRFSNFVYSDEVYKKYYIPYHSKLLNTVKEKLSKYSLVYILDCHTFNDIPLHTDISQSPNRPDVCLGVNYTITPSWLVDYLRHNFVTSGYSVDINNPYSGCIIPEEYNYVDSHVHSIMIEVNKRVLESEASRERMKSLLKEVIVNY